jgi:hypothetical protein
METFLVSVLSRGKELAKNSALNRREGVSSPFFFFFFFFLFVIVCWGRVFFLKNYKICFRKAPEFLQRNREEEEEEEERCMK